VAGWIRALAFLSRLALDALDSDAAAIPDVNLDRISAAAVHVHAPALVTGGMVAAAIVAPAHAAIVGVGTLLARKRALRAFARALFTLHPSPLPARHAGQRLRHIHLSRRRACGLPGRRACGRTHGQERIHFLVESNRCLRRRPGARLNLLRRG
jgi:hypothetical protein